MGAGEKITFPKVQLAFYRDDFGCLRRTVVFSSTQALSLLYTLCECTAVVAATV